MCTLSHTRMECPIHAWNVPYAYTHTGLYAYGTTYCPMYVSIFMDFTVYRFLQLFAPQNSCSVASLACSDEFKQQRF